MRDRIQSILDNTDGKRIMDSTSVDYKNFKWTNGYFLHSVSKREIEKPYLISYAYFGTVDYWDLILLLNNIGDPFEMIPLSQLYIPKLEDIKQFILENRK